MRTIGRWELREKLGQGAMGVVFSAWDASLGRLVAMKLLKSGADEIAQERLRREAQALGRVRHPNVVSVHEVGVHEKTPFVVMELVQGKPLSDLIGRAPREELLIALEQAARGVAAVHEAGIVHRDVKPANILVDAERARIADFGIVRLDDSSSLTASNALIGTPLYMPPELALSNRGAVGPASDVFSLGVILFEILVGEPPLAGAASMLSVLQDLSSDEPFSPPSEKEPTARPWDELCAAALEKDPARRLSSAADFADRLAAVREGRASPARSRRGLVALLAATTAVVAAAALVVAGARSTKHREPVVPVAPPVVAGSEVLPEAPVHAAQIEPSWFHEQKGRPASLPEGVLFGKERGEYVNAKDGTILVWVPGERPFFVGKLEVTIEQYARFVYATAFGEWFDSYTVEPFAYEPTACWAAPHGRRIRSNPRDPVAQVSWHEAQAYARWAGLRLLKVSEWQRTAYFDPTTGETRAFPWGNEPPEDGGFANERDRSFDLEVMRYPDSSHWRDGFARAAPVGSFPRGASPVGALDMYGNVAEICEEDDAAADAYDAPSHAKRTFPLPDKNRLTCHRNVERLIRVVGSSWSHPHAVQPDGCAVAREDMGFRLARDP